MICLNNLKQLHAVDMHITLLEYFPFFDPYNMMHESTLYIFSIPPFTYDLTPKVISDMLDFLCFPMFVFYRTFQLDRMCAMRSTQARTSSLSPYRPPRRRQSARQGNELVPWRDMLN